MMIIIILLIVVIVILIIINVINKNKRKNWNMWFYNAFNGIIVCVKTPFRHTKTPLVIV